MRPMLCLIPFLAPTAALAEAFQRPIPQPQTAEAELAYLAASLIFLAALIAVQWLVNRR
ncbi:hypothetical protein [Tabrizicola sp.]|uniref:hypothetical protein n=1 Tax=Tabrizicola sp. TaxID=2005166 RepID=UPI002735ACBA|nr:hypothetical protein [Tabrizicola sp.]MDP3196101.1 hypothetical protein [Tabrizicola sp.]